MAGLDIKILTVDSSLKMRRIIKDMLRRFGYYNLLEAEDGKDALDYLKKVKIDCILSDWNIPEISGLELLKIIRSDQELRSIPFFMITAEADKENIMKAINEGVTDYIVRPFNIGTLKKKMDSLSKLKKKRRASSL